MRRAPFTFLRAALVVLLAVAGVNVVLAGTTAAASAVAPQVTLNPVSQTAYSGGTLTFSAAASGRPTPRVVWQLSVENGSSWITIKSLRTTTFTTGRLTEFEKGWELRARFSNRAGSAVTSPATIGIVPTGLAWSSPASVAIGVPFALSSTDRCPTTMPDGSRIIGGTVYAAVQIKFGVGSVVGNAAPANPDGSWSIPWALLGTPPTGSFTISALCRVIPSQVVIAEYAPHPITVS